MGFFDKVKNMFTEEVEDDVKVEQIKKQVTQVPIESPNAKEVKETTEEYTNFEFETTKQIPKPVFFDDNDFKDLKLSEHKEEEKAHEEAKEFYIGNAKKEEEEPKKIFKPTPIISPVYGVLDKNYHKEDIVARKDTNNANNISKKPSIDAVRDKAYGTLEDELENTLFGSNSILFKHEEKPKEEETVEEIDSETLSNLTDDISKELDELLMEKKKYNESSDNTEDMNDEDLLGFIDSTLYKEGEEE